MKATRIQKGNNGMEKVTRLTEPHHRLKSLILIY